ncbi:hypothetical protein [Treponema sp.]|uniref:hypothetical protein n=1 Tax=Treponema sp. TaxID=166 RepID=UPI003890BA2D
MDGHRAWRQKQCNNKHEYAQIVYPDKTIVITSLSEFAVPISSEDGSYSFTLKNGAYISGQIAY